ncbi:MAG: YbaB/EbfC family nucleoid-associated protein [Propionibacteriales bacterium]|nr:YbaB/EbfC family nucleoid-associated protein [Propionibacteriales bacterium]
MESYDMPRLVEALKDAGERGDFEEMGRLSDRVNAGVHAMQSLLRGVFTASSESGHATARVDGFGDVAALSIDTKVMGQGVAAVSQDVMEAVRAATSGASDVIRMAQSKYFGIELPDLPEQVRDPYTRATTPAANSLREHLRAQLDHLPSDIPELREAFEAAIEQQLIATVAIYAGEASGGTVWAEMDSVGHLRSLEIARGALHGQDNVSLSKVVLTAIGRARRARDAAMSAATSAGASLFDLLPSGAETILGVDLRGYRPWGATHR